MRCLALRHVAFEDLGVWEDEIRAHGYDIAYLDAGVDPLDACADAELLVVLGGPIGVGDGADYPVIGQEVAVVRERLAAGQPTVGVCLGAQVMAAALGARVHPGTWELGWGRVQLTPAGEDSPLRHLTSAPVLHWHGDTFDLPDGAALLASTLATPHQAFSAGAGLALQFHVEADARRIEQWLIGHTSDLRAHGVDLAALRRESRQAADDAAAAGRAVIRDYLQAVA